MLRWREDVIDADGSTTRVWSPRIRIGPCEGQGKLTEKEARRLAWENHLSRLDQNNQTPMSIMTVAEFVQRFFVPEHVMLKKSHTQLFYRSRLKDLLKPGTVNRIFGKDSEEYAEKYQNARQEISGWPYLDELRLRDLRQGDIQKIISAALMHQYSSRTVNAIRTVCSAIITYAKEKGYFTGENPASSVRTPTIEPVKELHALTLKQARAVLEQMSYPLYHISLLSMLTSMNIAEICGLQWKRVNLSDQFVVVDAETMPPFAMLVRRQWNNYRLETVKRKSRKRALPIPPVLLPILVELKQRTQFTGPDDFVLASRNGTPIDAHNYFNRGLRAIGTQVGMPWLSWHVFRRTHTTLADELGMSLQDRQAMMGHANVAMTMHYTQQSVDRRRNIIEQMGTKLLERKGNVQ
jgi:integrase